LTNAWNDTGGSVVNAIQTGTVCLRNPLGGDNDNGNCHTELSTTQGGLALGAAATVVSGGSAAFLEGGTAAFFDSAGTVVGLAGSETDLPACFQGDTASCIGFGLGGVGAAAGLPLVVCQPHGTR